MKNDVLTWLAQSPLASALKIGASAAFVWIIDNVTELGLPPVVAVSLVAALPVLINALNPADSRYGRNAS